MNLIDVTISLVSYNQRFDIERLLPSLLGAAVHVQAEVLLVDCQSKDGTVQFVHEQFPEVEILVNPKRAGYGENHNINLERAKGRYFVIMNSDMMVDQDTFINLLDFIDKHDDVGIVSPKILNEDGTVQGLNKRYPTITDLFIRRFSRVFLVSFQSCADVLIIMKCVMLVMITFMTFHYLADLLCFAELIF